MDDVTRKERRIGCMSMMVIMYFLMMVLFGVLLATGVSSCRSVKYVPVEKVRVDSILVSKHDTIKHTEIKKEKEYVFVKDSSSVVVDDSGKVLRQEIWHNKTIIKEKSDSLNHYKALTDSLLSIKRDSVQVPYPVERELTKAEKRYISIGKVSLGIFVGMAAVFIAWLVVRIRRRLTMKG